MKITQVLSELLEPNSEPNNQYIDSNSGALLRSDNSGDIVITLSDGSDVLFGSSAVPKDLVLSDGWKLLPKTLSLPSRKKGFIPDNIREKIEEFPSTYRPQVKGLIAELLEYIDKRPCDEPNSDKKGFMKGIKNILK